jgi:hypothetical protein
MTDEEVKGKANEVMANVQKHPRSKVFKRQLELVRAECKREGRFPGIPWPMESEA